MDDEAITEFASVYLTSYNPNTAGPPNRGFDINYLGDAGFSGNPLPGDPQFFQVVAPKNANLLVVVNNSTPGVFGVPFHIQVEGFYDTAFNDVPEPSSVFLAGSGLLLLAFILLWRRRCGPAP